MPEMNIVTHEELEARLAPIEKRLDNLEKPEVPGSGPIPVEPGEDLQHAIDNSGGRTIILKDGTYPPFYVRSGTHIQAENDKCAIISGLVDYNNGWVEQGAGWFNSFKVPLHQHPANRVHGGDSPSERGLNHRLAMRPQLLLFNGEVMLPSYTNLDWGNGKFRLVGTSENPEGLEAWFPGAAHPVDHNIQTSYHQQLIGAAPGISDVDDVTLEGLVVRGAANTKTIGAINFPSEADNWTLRSLEVDMSSGEGVVIRGRGHTLEHVVATNHGITAFASNNMNECRLLHCEGSFSSWKPGLDHMWHSGNKFSNSSRNTLSDFVSRSCAIWFDISNMDNILDGFLVDGAYAFGLHIENYTLGSAPDSAQAYNGIIKNVRAYEGIGSGLQIQGNVKHYHFRNIEITGCADGAVYYKKREVRGPSGFNKFEDVRMSGNGNENRFAVQGDMNQMPDVFVDVDLSSLQNWP